VTDVQDEIREMLRHKAGEMPAHLDVPPSLAGRVGPRIARNAALVVAGLAVVAVVATAGFRSLNGPPETAPYTGGPDPSGTSTSACSGGSLKAVAPLEGAAGSREGSITLQNTSDATCTLRGTPTLTMVAPDGRPVDSVDVQQGPSSWKVDGAPAPAGWPIVTVEPGSAGSVRLGWSNWCDTSAPAPVMVLSSGGVEVARVEFDAATVPPCDGQDLPSTIEIGPFEPSS
jgi:hypothetical protein